jgi:hypothetical protein
LNSPLDRACKWAPRCTKSTGEPPDRVKSTRKAIVMEDLHRNELRILLGDLLDYMCGILGRAQE